MILFSGTSNSQLTKEIATSLGVSLGKVEVTRFIDSECRVRILEEVKDQVVFVVQSLSTVADQNLVELCLFATALKSLGAKKVIAVIPWMGYSKQDKAFRNGEAISMQLVARFIEAAGFDEVITVELHSDMVKQYFQIPLVELSTHKIFDKAIRLKNNCIVVSPDMGGRSRSELFARNLKLPIIYLEKQRDKETGVVSVTGISKDVEGKTAIIFDDIINTGATAVETSKYLKDHGVSYVLFLATHAVFAGTASEALRQGTIDQIIVTNTITFSKEKHFPSLEIISVSSLLADAISLKMH